MKNRLTSLLSVSLLLIVAFWLRLDFLLAGIFHIDEHITMLAAKLITERGWPIFPSGIFYDHGLLFSFWSAALIALADFREEIARWGSLIAGTMTVALYYALGRMLFGSRWAGLFAALLATLDASTIVWSGRARMYALAHLFVLLSLVWSLRATFQAPSERNRYLLLIFTVAAALSHSISLIIIPPILATIGLFSLLYNHRWLKQPRLWLQTLIAGLAMSGVVAIVALGQNSGAVSLHDGAEPARSVETSSEPTARTFQAISRFLQPKLDWSRLDDLVDFFSAPPYLWLLLPVMLGLCFVIYRFWRRQTTFADWAYSFLFLYSLLTILEMGTILGSNWQEPRYLFILVLPAFLLVAGDGLRQCLGVLQGGLAHLLSTHRPRKRIEGALVGLSILSILILQGPGAWQTVKAQSTGDYNTAFAFVREQWEDGDQMMTVHPAAAYLYLGHNDYYASETSARVLVSEDAFEFVDRYTGKPLINSVEKFNVVLAQGSRIWFVVDIGRLYGRFNGFFTQQIFAQMNHVRQFGPTHIFLSERFPRPLPASPEVLLEAPFVDAASNPVISLSGYSLQPRLLAPDGTLPLYLYWHPHGEQPASTYKVFVHLRNAQNQPIAQADHYIFEQLLNVREWTTLQRENEWLRETAMLQLPIPFPQDQGPYHLYIGLYHPETFERLRLLGDESGENAVVLPFPAF